MLTNQKATGRAVSMPKGLLAGAVMSVLSTVLWVAVLAKLLDAEMIEWDQIGYGIMGVLLFSSVMGALGSSSKIKRQKLIVCVLSGVIYFSVLMALTALFFGGQYEAVGVTALLILGSSISCGLLVAREGSKGYKRKRYSKRN